MTHRHGGTTPERRERSFEVGQLTRVEGEGSLDLRVVRDGEVVEAQLGIFEAPRYFERLVVGRTPDEVIDIVARICGICPVAYQMRAVHAFEALFDVEIDPAIRACAASSIAASGSRATPSTSTCSTRPTSWATPARSRWRATTARSSSARSRSSAPATAWWPSSAGGPSTR